MSLMQPIQSGEMYKLICERDDALIQLERHKQGVTICIPTHNEPVNILSRAIVSAINQTVPPIEIIIIDDGSDVPATDCGYEPKDETTIRVVRITNRGLPAARNTALMLARGYAFLPCDADDWLRPDYIEKTLPLLADADVVLAGLQEWGDEPRNQAYNPGFDRPYDQVGEEILWQYNRFFYAALFRTELLREIGGYHPAMAGWPGVAGGYEDWDVWIDLMHRGTRFAAVNEPLLNYTTKQDSMLTRAERNRETLMHEMHRHHGR